MSSGPDQVESGMFNTSALLEELPHSAAFDAMLDANLLSKKTFSACKALEMDAEHIPPEISNNHFWPARFVLADFASRLVQLPESDDSPSTWHLETRFNIDGTPYELNANSESALLTHTGFDGQELHYTYPSETGLRFLAALSLSAFQVDRTCLPPDLDDPSATMPQKINGLLYIIGNCGGEFKSQTTSYLPDLERDRALVVRRVESESPRTSGINVHYDMIWQIGEQVLIGMVSQQGEVVVHSADSSAFGPQQLSTRFSLRKAATLLPDQILMGELFEDDPDIVQFIPDENPVEYWRVNTAIMMVLQRYLQPFAHLDSSVAENHFKVAKAHRRV